MKNLDPNSEEGCDLDSIQKLLTLLNTANAEAMSHGMYVKPDSYHHPVHQVNQATRELVWRAI
jgi:hypothetical protein